jgi:cyclic-di-GMP-binding protein
LLLSLTDPYRLAQGETDKVIAQLRAYRGLATLGQARPATPPGGHFLVPCDTDKPPKPLLSANDDKGGAHWRLLDANPIVDKLRMKKSAVESGNVSATMSKAMGPEGLALLAKLVTLWGDPPKRAARRDPTEGTVAICVGLKAVSHFVSLEPKLDLATEDEMLRRGITMPVYALAMDDASQPIPVFEWNVVNQSPGGIKVRRMGPTQQPIAVGEVVGIKSPGKAHWTIGVVRWITMFDEGGMEFGLQYLAPMARMVWVQPTTATSPQAKLGLLLGEGPRPAGLITPPNTHAELREFEITEEGTVSCMRASTLVEKTGRFELFNVTPS